MIIHATREEVIHAAALAIAVSVPVGMGVLDYRATDNIPDVGEIVQHFNHKGDLYIDYFRGRMVKMYMRYQGDDRWEVDDTTKWDYQSWKRVYDTYEELLAAAKGM